MSFLFRSSLVTLADLDREVLVKFYTKFLDLEPNPYIPNSYAEFQLPGLRLGIFKPKDSHKSEFANRAKTGMSLCLEVSDIETAIARIWALGCPPPGEIVTASHGREIYAFDPAGNRLILHQSSQDRSS
ncbi:MAG: VOC family protein [Oscillatoriales cyanobacterium RU_3_3]|nr:VOC family protein [Microcoleus sp. SU_5_6]NJL68543.1 VOC family protein [Microcoleus sp. SM1_3_4]NJM59834.1 VOC family protein [Oscillatoriales cyanobacterium RU_3_3]NJR21164.1 VOC family protein [Richelia sp. CSU_2_1]